MPTQPTSSQTSKHDLVRGLTITSAIGVNIIDMVGVGPFITLPLIITAMGGPQAMLGWLLGALLSLIDGLTWSELGTAYPEAGGSYVYLKNLYGKQGRIVSFLYAWQLLFSAPLSIASGCIGFAQYATWFLPSSAHRFASAAVLHVPIVLSGQTLIAMAACATAIILLYRPIRIIDHIAKVLGFAVILALLIIIAVGFTHFSPARAFALPAGAFHLDNSFFAGMAAGLLIAVYDYWGYYNICFLGAEVRDPGRTIPRAVLGSIAIVGTLYLLMNTAVLGVLPWRELTGANAAAARQYTMAVFMQRAFSTHSWSHAAASGIVILIALASLASVFALLLGYSRIPYAAAKDGNFPRIFTRLHPRHHFPSSSLLILGAITLACCLFRLQEVIASLVVIRILFQFLLQAIAVLLPKHRRARQTPGRFRMPFYPIPVILALAGFIFILFSRPNFIAEIRLAAIVLVAGLLVYGLRKRLTVR